MTSSPNSILVLRTCSLTCCIVLRSVFFKDSIQPNAQDPLTGVSVSAGQFITGVVFMTSTVKNGLG